ncbi:MAG: VWA domain-containing protein [Planctomycetota bacterium]|nr:VWA domain-containing protein [Planctomycetota bacterium]
MYWRYGKADSLDKLVRDLLRIYRQLLLIFDGDVETSLEQLDHVGQRYQLWREDFGIEEFKQLLERSGEARRDARGLMKMTRKGERALRRQALQDIFRGMDARALGEHRTTQTGGSGEIADETRPFEFGDSVDTLDAHRTLSNWVKRTGGEGDIAEDDLEVRERERNTSCATVLLIDVSHSMTLYGEDRITPAKRVALALTELILTKYPKDTIDVVLFGDEATTVPLERLPYLSNGPFHTNTRAGLMMAQDILRRRKAVNRQIVMLTDGKPSAIHDDGGIYKNPFGLDRRIVNKTLEEAVRCRRRGIRVTTFMLTSDPYLQKFIENFTEACRGQAYFADSARIESFVLVDFMRNRRRRVR